MVFGLEIDKVYVIEILNSRKNLRLYVEPLKILFPMIQIKHRQLADLYILDLNGQFRADTEYSFWRAVQTAVVENGARNLILNFSELSQIDSYGISELLRVQKSIHNLEGQLILVGLNDLVRRVFEITKVGELFHIVDTEAAATEHLRPELHPAPASS